MDYTYNADVVRVVDADTIDVRIDLGFNIKHKIRLRIKDYDAPEIYRPQTRAERKHGDRALVRAEELLLNKEVVVCTHKFKKGKYGRYIADVFLKDNDKESGINYATTMKNEGFDKLDSYNLVEAG